MCQSKGQDAGEFEGKKVKDVFILRYEEPKERWKKGQVKVFPVAVQGDFKAQYYYFKKH